VHLSVHSISACKCISILAQSRPPSGFLSSLHLSLQAPLQTGSITASKYIFKEQWRLYWDTGLMEVDRVMGSIYSADCGVHRHHLISISFCHIMKIQSLSFSTVSLARSVEDCVDPVTCLNPQRRVISYLLTKFRRSLNQNSSFSDIPFGCLMGVSWCSSDYARVPSAARCTVCIYLEKLRYCMPYYAVANLVTVTKTNMIRQSYLKLCKNHCCENTPPCLRQILRPVLGFTRRISQSCTTASAALEVSRRAVQRSQELQNWTIL
jgi:hypothetical protein